MEEIAANLERVRQRIAAAAQKCGRAADQIELVAVSKTHPAERCRRFSRPGRCFSARAGCRKRGPRFRSCLRACAGISSGTCKRTKSVTPSRSLKCFTGSTRSLSPRTCSASPRRTGCSRAILLEVNVAGEASKHGFTPEAVRRELESVLSLGRLTVEGLMTIPPFAPEAEASRRYFVTLRELRDATGSGFRRQAAATFDGDEWRLRDRDRGRRDPRARGHGDLWRTSAAPDRVSSFRTVSPAPMHRIFLATRNGTKRANWRRSSEPDFVLEDLRSHPEIGEVVEDGATFLENARLKAVTISRQLPGPGPGR